jgi:hypothetical protein
LYASTRGKTSPSYEHEDWKHGVFTLALIEGLKGKDDHTRLGFIEADALGAYVRMRVHYELTKKTQDPVFLSDTGPMRALAKYVPKPVLIPRSAPNRISTENSLTRPSPESEREAPERRRSPPNWGSTRGALAPISSAVFMVFSNDPLAASAESWRGSFLPLGRVRCSAKQCCRAIISLVGIDATRPRCHWPVLSWPVPATWKLSWPRSTSPNEHASRNGA